MDEKRCFLILGGNGFIGFETVLAISDTCSGILDACAPAKDDEKRRYCLILLNRGRSWDWDKLDTLSKSSSPFCSVTHVRYNRKESPEDCSQLVSLMASMQNVSAVIDFSAYRPAELRTFVEYVRGKCQLYVFISTDSVYEVCLEKHHSGALLETDAIRPSLESDRQKYGRCDRYGHQKLRCEEYLHRQSLCPDGIPSVVFRLADVIGPRDGTDRFWQYLLWLKLCLHHDLPFYVHEASRDKLISLCYVKDVATFLARFLYNSMLNDQVSRTSPFRCYNLALVEMTTVEHLIKLIHDELPSKTQLKIVYTDKDCVPQMLPSVSCGPISVMKATNELVWAPSSLLHAVKDTVYYYQKIGDGGQFSKEKKECMEELLDDLKGVYPQHTESFRQSLKSFLKL